ncbi:MAG TPA: hypothetical protein VJ552_03775 [Sediminibacterium sp.]|nr:hypothetical protein [Sediminibacterium sp.]
MKRLFVLIGMVCFNPTVDAQVFKKKWGVGTQLTDRLYGISIKYALSPAAGVQAVACPFNTKTADGLGSLRYYGLRYLYKLPADPDYYIRIEPFVAAGAGLLDYQPDTGNMFMRPNSGAAAGATDRQRLMGYSAGAGLEWWMGEYVSLSAEIDYGRMRFNNGVADHAFFGAAGLHVFLK